MQVSDFMLEEGLGSIVRRTSCPVSKDMQIRFMFIIE